MGLRGLGLAFIGVVLAPIINPLIAIINIFSSVKAYYEGHWSDYTGFNATSSCTKLFYHTQDHLFQKHGIHGNTDRLSFAPMPMRRFWYHNLLSLRIFVATGILTNVLTGLVWIISFFAITTQLPNPLWACICLFLAIGCSGFHGNFFDRQNYNAFGWMFLPCFIFFVFQANVIWLALFGAVILIGSTTAFISAFLLVVVFAILTWQPYLLWSLILPFILLVTQFLVGIKKVGLITGAREVGSLLGFIGVRNKSVTYSRPIRIAYPTVWMILSLVFPAVLFVNNQSFSSFSPASLAIFASIPAIWLWFNQTHLFRIADPQSIVIVQITLHAAILMCLPDAGWLALLAFWIANSNPFIVLALFQDDKPNKLRFAFNPLIQPFTLDPLLSSVRLLSAHVPDGSTLLISCDDPGQDYNQLFDRQGLLLETIRFIVLERNIRTLPTFYSALYEPEYHFWGRSVDSIKHNLNFARSSHVLFYHTPDRQEEARALESAGFVEVSTLDWAKEFPELIEGPLFSGLHMIWTIYRAPDAVLRP